MTRAGVLYIAMTLLLSFAAVNTGNNLLYLIVSALLGFMAVSGVLGRLNLAGVGVRLQVPDEIYDGVETLLTVHVENYKRCLPSFLLTARLPCGSATVVQVDRRESTTASLRATFHGRGIHTLDAARVESIFPINFFLRSFAVPLNRTVVVFPAPAPCRCAGQEGRLGTEGEVHSSRKGYEGDLSRISDYSGSEPLKLVHWKLSARHDRLKVKELSAVDRPPVLIELEAIPGSLEERLRCASWLVGAALRENRPVGLRLARLTLPPASGRAHKLRLLKELATYGQR